MSFNTNGSVFGADRVQGLGYQFDVVEFLKKPTTIIRLLSWFFAIIVFSCISSGGYVEDMCILQKSGACGFGIFVGVVAFLACIVFLVLDVVVERLSSVQHRKFVVTADLGFSGVWSFFYFVSFCFLANKLAYNDAFFFEKNVQSWQVSNIKASIAFSFFSIASFAGLTFFAFERFKQGSQGAFESSDQIESQVNAGGNYPGFAQNPEGGYQKQPFSEGAPSGDLSTGTGQYQQPSY